LATADVCLLPSKARSSPKTPSVSLSCEHRWYWLKSGNCYEECDDGYVDSWTKDCWKECAVGSRLNEMYGICHQNAFEHDYHEGSLPFNDRPACEKIHKSCAYDESYDGYIPYCANPRSDESWRCKTEKGERGIMAPKKTLECQDDRELVNGSCYVPCPKGYQGTGKVCVSGQCPAGYTQCGKYCVKGTSCESSLIENFEVFVTFVQRGTDFQVNLSKYLCENIN